MNLTPFLVSAESGKVQANLPALVHQTSVRRGLLRLCFILWSCERVCLPRKELEPWRKKCCNLVGVHVAYMAAVQ